MTEIDIREALRRPARYWNCDGLPLLAMGMVWILWGSGLLVAEMAEGYWRLAVLPLTIICLGAAFSVNPVIKRIKERITEPRTGAMQLREEVHLPAMVVAFSTSLALAALMAVIRMGMLGQLSKALPCLLGLVIGGGSVYAARRCQLRSYSTVGLLALAAGIGVTLFGPAFPASIGAFIVLYGLASALCGALDLRSYLRAHPQPAGAVETQS